MHQVSAINVRILQLKNELFFDDHSSVLMPSNSKMICFDIDRFNGLAERNSEMSCSLASPGEQIIGPRS